MIVDPPEVGMPLRGETDARIGSEVILKMIPATLSVPRPDVTPTSTSIPSPTYSSCGKTSLLKPSCDGKNVGGSHATNADDTICPTAADSKMGDGDCL